MDKPICLSIEEHDIRAASEATAREIGIASLKTKQIEAITSFITGYFCFFVNWVWKIGDLCITAFDS